MFNLPTTLKDYHAFLRDSLFMEMWNDLNPPLKDPYTFKSLPAFEKGLLKRFSSEEAILMPILACYAFYLGETLVKEMSNAKWVYPITEDVTCCEVKISLPDGSSSSIFPFNTVFKLVRGKSQNLMSIVETMCFMAENHQTIEHFEKGRKTVMPNGATVRVFSPNEAG